MASFIQRRSWRESVRERLIFFRRRLRPPAAEPLPRRMAYADAGPGKRQAVGALGVRAEKAAAGADLKMEGAAVSPGTGPVQAAAGVV